jgi:putative heme-binding domain-containing protein
MAAVLSLLAAQISFGQNTANPPSVRTPTKRDYKSFALSHQGDVARGRELFFGAKAACSRCHNIDGTGIVGPDLATVGDKFGRSDLIQSILEPSSEIAVGYETTIVETKAGDLHQGILKHATDIAIELVGAEAKPFWIDTNEIRHRSTSRVSMMPDGLEAALTTAEFADVIEFLASLKLPATAQVNRHGMPETISELGRPISLQPFHAADLKFEHPVWFGFVPGLSLTYAVVEHEFGRIWLLEKNPAGDDLFAELEEQRLPVAGGTRGFIGLVFHPRFAENRKYYVALHVHEGADNYTLTIEREAAADLRQDSGRPGREILRVKCTAAVHYGGGMQFGPDGYLYIGMGDSGPQEDPQGNAQNPQLLRGKLMRIDVDHRTDGKNYSIPADNPFANSRDVRPEIWAIGFREPWRFSFDPLTKELWVGDVGQYLFEEVDIVRRGENFGWNVYEGFNPFSNRYRKTDARYVPPLFAYTRKYGVSVTGGFVYRADPKSSFYGIYIFGDYQTRRIFGLTQQNRELKQVRQIGTCPERITSFGIDAQGELYIAGYEGTIYRLDFRNALWE